MILVICSLVILSDFMRSLLQETFAVLCQYFADDPVFFTLIFVALTISALLRLSAWQTLHTVAFVVLGQSLTSFRSESDSPRPFTFFQAYAVFSVVYFLGFVGNSTLAHVLRSSSRDGPEDIDDRFKTIDAKDPQVIIVGAGTAGAPLAITLARQGIKVVVIEKNMQRQDRFVGELMQPGGIQALRTLGLEDCVNTDTDVVIEGYTIIPNCSMANISNQNLKLPYPDRIPQTFLELLGYHRYNNGTGTQRGRGFHNGDFVQRLREVMLKEENITVIEGTVSELLQDKKGCFGVEYRAKFSNTTDAASVSMETGPSIKLLAPLVVVADGIWSSFRRGLSQDNPKQISTFVGTIMTHPENESPVVRPNFGHVVLANPSPILMYQISPTETRVLVDIPGKIPSSSNGQLTKYLCEFVAPQLPVESRAAFIKSVEDGPVKSMPNREFHTTQPALNGVIMLGDSYNMRHPLTGGGMSVALNDVVLLSELLKGFDHAKIIGSKVKTIRDIRQKFENQRQLHASTINILANALYHVFAAPEDSTSRTDLRDSCYEYLKLGGMFMSGPLGLLCALTPSPMILAMHFFMVAGYAAFRCLSPYPTWAGMVRCYHVFHVACYIIMPLIERENVTILSWKPLTHLINFLFPYRETKK